MLVLLLLGAAAYANALHGPFILDDKLHILWDDTIKPPLSIRKLLSNDRPVVSVSLALNYAASGFTVESYHVVNLGAHIVCGLLLYGWARATLRLPALRARWGDAAGALALAAAAVFLVHPIQTESVTYIIQRAEIFAAMALLGVLWIGAVATQRAPYGLHLLALTAVSLCGSFSKESMVVAPLLFALYDWCCIAAGNWRALVRRWPIYLTLVVLACGAAGLRWWQATQPGAEPLGGVVIGSAAAPPAAAPAPSPAVGGAAVAGPEALTPWRYLRSQFGVLVYYLRLVAWPNRLCFDCGYLGAWPVRASVLGERVWLPALLLGAMALAAWCVRRRAPLVTFGVLGSAVALAPTSSLLPLTDAYVEHRLYLPIAFLALAAVSVAYDAGAAAVRRGWLSSTVARALGWAAVVAVIGVFGRLTIARNDLYRDPIRLWEDSLAKAPQNERTLYNLGNEYSRRGLQEQAIETFRQLIRLDPDPAPYYINLGKRYLELHRFPEAVEAFEQARARAPEKGIVHRNLMVAYTRVGRLADAVAAAEQATTLEPLNTHGHMLLGDAYRRVGRIADAQHAYRTVLFFDPNDAEARRKLSALGGDGNR